MSSLDPTTHQLERTFGVFLNGYVIAMVAYGFTFFQTCIYYSRYPKDDWETKWTVAAVCCLDTAVSALLTHALYVYLILQYPWTPAGIVDVSSSFCAQFGLSALAILIIQAHYALQMRRANNYGLLAGFIGIVSLGSFFSSFFITTQIFMKNSLSHFSDTYMRVIMTAAQALVSLAALGTPVSLFYLRRRSKAKPITNLFDIFLSYAFDHGVLTTLVQLGFCVVFAAMPSRVLWMPFQFMATKLFVNSFLSQLNSREKFQGRGVAHGIKTPFRPGRSILLNDNALSMPTIQFADHPNSVVRAGPGAEPFWHRHNGEPVDKRPRGDEKTTAKFIPDI